MNLINLLIEEKKYSSLDEDVEVFENFNISFENKGFIALVGESGCGKTTLLNILGLKDFDYKGSLIIDNILVQNLNTEELDYFRTNYISYCFQETFLIDNLSVLENINIGCSNLEISTENINDALIKVKLNIDVNNKVKTLSGGERQKLCLAISLLRNTPIILCDEVTGNLDEENSENIFTLLQDISKEKLILLVSHDYDNCTKYSDKVIDLEHYENKDLVLKENNKKLSIATKSKFVKKIKNCYKALFKRRFGTLIINTIFFVLTMLIATIPLSVITCNSAKIACKILDQYEDDYYLISNSEVIYGQELNEESYVLYNPYDINDEFENTLYYKPANCLSTFDSFEYSQFSENGKRNLYLYHYLNGNENISAGRIPQTTNEILINYAVYQILMPKKSINEFEEFTISDSFCINENLRIFNKNIEYKVVGIVDNEPINFPLFIIRDQNASYCNSISSNPFSLYCKYYEGRNNIPSSFVAYNNEDISLVGGSLPQNDNEFIISLNYLQKISYEVDEDYINKIIGVDYMSKIKEYVNYKYIYGEMNFDILSDEFKIVGVFDDTNIDGDIVCTQNYLNNLKEMKNNSKGYSFIKSDYKNIKKYTKSNYFLLFSPIKGAGNDFTNSIADNYTGFLIFAGISLLSFIVSTIIDIVHIIRYKKNQIILLRVYGYKEKEVKSTIIFYFAIPLLISLIFNLVLGQIAMQDLNNSYIPSIFSNSVVTLSKMTYIPFNFWLTILIYVVAIIIFGLFINISLFKIKKELKWYSKK